MATTAKRRQDAVVMGDLAYKRKTAPRETIFTPEYTTYEQERQAQVEVQEIARVAQSVPVVAMVGFAAVVMMAVMMMVSYVQLTDLSTQVTSLRTELSLLETENITLTTTYEQMFDLATVKESATTSGMTKPSSSQIYYIDLSGGDTAVVYETPEKISTVDRLMNIVTDRIDTMIAYFS